MQQVGQELGVTFILEGSVRKAGQRVRITAQLIDGKDGAHLWADRYDRDLTDIFAIQDEITHTIVDQLKVRLLPEEKKAIEQAPTDNVEAYTHYLEGAGIFPHAHRRGPCNWRDGCSPGRRISIPTMRAPMPASPIAISYLSSWLASRIRSTKS